MSSDSNKIKEAHSRISRNSVIHYRNGDNDMNMKLSDLLNKDKFKKPITKCAEKTSMVLTDGKEIRSNRGIISVKNSRSETSVNIKKNKPAIKRQTKGVRGWLRGEDYCCLIDNKQFCNKTFCHKQRSFYTSDVNNERLLYEDYTLKLNKKEIHPTPEGLVGGLSEETGTMTVVIEDKTVAPHNHVYIEPIKRKKVKKMETRIVGFAFEFSYTLPSICKYLFRRKNKDSTDCRWRCLPSECKNHRLKVHHHQKFKSIPKSVTRASVSFTDQNRFKTMPEIYTVQSNNNYDQGTGKESKTGSSKGYESLSKSRGKTVKIDVGFKDDMTNSTVNKAEPARDVPNFKGSTLISNKETLLKQAFFKKHNFHNINNINNLYTKTVTWNEDSDEVFDNIINDKSLNFSKQNEQVETLYKNCNYQAFPNFSNIVYSSTKSEFSDKIKYTNSNSDCSPKNVFNKGVKLNNEDLNSKISCKFSVQSNKMKFDKNATNSMNKIDIAKCKKKLNDCCKSLNMFNNIGDNSEITNSNEVVRALRQMVVENYKCLEINKKRGENLKLQPSEAELRYSSKTSEIFLQPNNENIMGVINSEELETTDNEFGFPKTSPVVYADLCNYPQICLRISNIYDRLMKTEKRLRNILQEFQIPCEEFSNAKKKRPSESDEYRSTHYTIIRDLEKPNIIYITPPTDRQYKTCNCTTTKECMMIDFNKIINSGESCEVCIKKCEDLIEELQYNNVEDDNRGFCQRIGDLIAHLYHKNFSHNCYSFELECETNLSTESLDVEDCEKINYL